MPALIFDLLPPTGQWPGNVIKPQIHRYLRDTRHTLVRIHVHTQHTHTQHTYTHTHVQEKKKRGHCEARYLASRPVFARYSPLCTPVWPFIKAGQELSLARYPLDALSGSYLPSGFEVRRGCVIG